MLFRKGIDKACAYCQLGTTLEDGTIRCSKRGVVSADESCRKFTYDPLKRVPSKPKALDFSKYNEDDFSL